MKRWMFFTCAIALLPFAIFSGFRIFNPEAKSRAEDHSEISDYAARAARYADENNFDENICFLIDMKFEAGKNRFFVYDLKSKSILHRGLVTHGRCNQDWLSGRKYGNTVGCGCSSLGRYRVGNKYQGRFGLAYKLHGLDTSNSKAFERFVVLHSMECVPEAEVYPSSICQSDGCPTVSPDMLKQLSAIIDRSKKPVLLWIYE